MARYQLSSRFCFPARNEFGQNLTPFLQRHVRFHCQVRLKGASEESWIRSMEVGIQNEPQQVEPRGRWRKACRQGIRGGRHRVRQGGYQAPPVIACGVVANRPWECRAQATLAIYKKMATVFRRIMCMRHRDIAEQPSPLYLGVFRRLVADCFSGRDVLSRSQPLRAKSQVGRRQWI